MKSLPLLIAIAVLASCATAPTAPPKVLQLDTVETNSPHSVEQISACIIDAWSQHGGAVNSKPHDGGVTLLLTDAADSQQSVTHTIQVDDLGSQRRFSLELDNGVVDQKLLGEMGVCL